LLLLGARRHVDHDTRIRIRDLGGTNLDWPYLLVQARRHGVATLLYFNLRSVGVQAHAMDDLAILFRASAGHNLHLLGELLTVLDDLEQHQIAAIPFKGPVLAVTAFGDVSLREFSDLDLLVQEPDLASARNRLAQLGFRCIHHRDWIEPYVRFGHELDFISPAEEFQIDLQWCFAKKWLAFPLDLKEVWAQSIFISLGGRMVRQPCLEDSLMILCGHGYRHMWSCLKWISDVAAFIHAFGSRLRWERLIDQARLSGGLRILGLGLWLAQEVGGAPVPRSAAQILRDRQIPALGARGNRASICRL
jgi:hypothetical protein